MLVLHGDNLVASRNTLNKEIAAAKTSGTAEIIRLDGESLQLTDLIEAIETNSLFGQEKLVVVENLLSRKQQKAKQALFSYLAALKSTVPIILWEKKPLTQAQLKNLPAFARVQLFRLSPKIFALLDSISPGNQKRMLVLLKQCVEEESPELVFFMLARRVRQLIIASEGIRDGSTGLAPWQKQRISTQAKKFEPRQLYRLHEMLYRADKSIKTGRNILSLPSMLDLTLAEI